MTHRASSELSSIDKRYLAAAIRLGRSRVGRTAPNPSVGAILVQFDTQGPCVVGRGVTSDGGRPHGEANALKQAGNQAQGATCYVSLEPCAHTGKSPPCTAALIASGVARVVIAHSDPDERVSGAGVEQLLAAGIEITLASLIQAAEAHRGYLSVRTKQRPWVTLKLAVSKDGKIGKRGEPNLPITGAASIKFVHVLRARHDAIMVGAGTARLDQPGLNCRLPAMEDWSPQRVIIGGQRGEFEDQKTWQFPSEGQQVDLNNVMSDLATRNITSVFAEGGALLATTLLKRGFVDELIICSSQRVIGEDGVSAFEGYSQTEIIALAGLKSVASQRFADDVCVFYRRSSDGEV